MGQAGLGPSRAGRRLWAQGMPGAEDGQEQRQWHAARGWHPGRLEQEAAAMPPRGLSGLQLRDFPGCLCRNSSLGSSLPSAHPQPVGKGCAGGCSSLLPPRQHSPRPSWPSPTPCSRGPQPCGGGYPAPAAVCELAGGLLLGTGSPRLRGAGGSQGRAPRGLPACPHLHPSPFSQVTASRTCPGCAGTSCGRAPRRRLSTSARTTRSRARGTASRTGSHTRWGLRPGGLGHRGGPSAHWGTPEEPSCSGPGEGGLPAPGPPLPWGVPADPPVPSGVRGAERAGGGQEPGAAVEGDSALDQV